MNLLAWHSRRGTCSVPDEKDGLVFFWSIFLTVFSSLCLKEHTRLLLLILQTFQSSTKKVGQLHSGVHLHETLPEEEVADPASCSFINEQMLVTSDGSSQPNTTESPGMYLKSLILLPKHETADGRRRWRATGLTWQHLFIRLFLHYYKILNNVTFP